MPRIVKSEALSQEWHQHIDAWRISGESQQTFCNQRKHNYPRFLYWRRKFDASVVPKSSPRSSALVPVTYQSEPTVNGLTLHLPNGITLRGIAPDNLHIVERLLESLS